MANLISFVRAAGYAGFYKPHEESVGAAEIGHFHDREARVATRDKPLAARHKRQFLNALAEKYRLTRPGLAKTLGAMSIAEGPISTASIRRHLWSAETGAEPMTPLQDAVLMKLLARDPEHWQLAVAAVHELVKPEFRDSFEITADVEATFTLATKLGQLLPEGRFSPRMLIALARAGFDADGARDLAEAIDELDIPESSVLQYLYLDDQTGLATPSVLSQAISLGFPPSEVHSLCQVCAAAQMSAETLLDCLKVVQSLNMDRSAIEDYLAEGNPIGEFEANIRTLVLHHFGAPDTMIARLAGVPTRDLGIYLSLTTDVFPADMALNMALRNFPTSDAMKIQEASIAVELSEQEFFDYLSVVDGLDLAPASIWMAIENDYNAATLECVALLEQNGAYDDEVAVLNDLRPDEALALLDIIKDLRSTGYSAKARFALSQACETMDDLDALCDLLSARNISEDDLQIFLNGAAAFATPIRDVMDAIVADRSAVDFIRSIRHDALATLGATPDEIITLAGLPDYDVLHVFRQYRNKGLEILPSTMIGDCRDRYVESVTSLDSGSYNEVYLVECRNPRNGALQTFVFKPLPNANVAKAGMSAERAGITDATARIAQRNLATRALAELIGLEYLVPETGIGCVTPPGDPEATLGVAMSRARGVSGYESSPDDLLDAEIREQLMELGVLDGYCGQTDRHPDNYAVFIDYATGERHVTGYDHEQGFGSQVRRPIQVARNYAEKDPKKLGFSARGVKPPLVITDEVHETAMTLEHDRLTAALKDFLLAEEMEAQLARSDATKLDFENLYNSGRVVSRAEWPKKVDELVKPIRDDKEIWDYAARDAYDAIKRANNFSPNQNII